jgi:hypothetical protein
VGDEAQGATTVAERPPQASTDGTSTGTRSTPSNATPAPPTESTQDTSTPAAPRDAGTTAADQDAAHWEWLASRDPRELVQRHRQLAGYVGSESDRRARELEPTLRQQWEAESDLTKLRAELVDLRDGPNRDPDAYIEKERELEGKLHAFNQAQEKAQQEQTAQYRTLDGILKSVWEALPTPVRTSLSGRTWDAGHPGLSRQAYLADMLGELQKHASTTGAQELFDKELPRRLRDAEEGLRKDMAAEGNRDAPRLDTGAGAPPPNGAAVSQSEWNRAKSQGRPEFRAWRAANKDRINRGLSEGTLTQD